MKNHMFINIFQERSQLQQQVLWHHQTGHLDVLGGEHEPLESVHVLLVGHPDVQKCQQLWCHHLCGAISLKDWSYFLIILGWGDFFQPVLGHQQGWRVDVLQGGHPHVNLVGVQMSSNVNSYNDIIYLGLNLWRKDWSYFLIILGWGDFFKPVLWHE